MRKRERERENKREGVGKDSERLKECETMRMKRERVQMNER